MEVGIDTYFGPIDPRHKAIALEIERKFFLGTPHKSPDTYKELYLQGETMPDRYIAVFNTNPQGALVARLVPISKNDLNLTGTAILESARRNKIKEVQHNLPTGHKVVGVSNVLPSSYGLGGAYIFPVRLHTIPQPDYEIDMGPYARKIKDLIPNDNPGTWKPEGGDYGDY